MASRQAVRRTILAAGAALAVLAGVPVQAGVVGVPGKMFFAKNATKAALTCSVKLDQKDWSPNFTLAAGREISLQAPTGDSRLSVKCNSPVEGGPYVLEAGERYAFLPGNGGKVMLRHVDI